MKAIILAEAEADLEQAFRYYNLQRPDLGQRFLDEYRHALERICAFPNAWSPMDDTYRRYRMRRFPYGIIYRVDDEAQQAVLVAISHLSREPYWWRERED